MLTLDEIKENIRNCGNDVHAVCEVSDYVQAIGLRACPRNIYGDEIAKAICPVGSGKSCRRNFTTCWRCYFKEKAAIEAGKTSSRESELLNGFCDKLVFIKFCDGSVAVGILHKDTLATYTQCPEFDDKRVIGYYLEAENRRIHFKKSHVKRIREAR